MTQIYTHSELEAQTLLLHAGIVGLSTSSERASPHWSGNYIIALAEKIKAERAVVGMKEKP